MGEVWGSPGTRGTRGGSWSPELVLSTTPMHTEGGLLAHAFDAWGCNRRDGSGGAPRVPGHRGFGDLDAKLERLAAQMMSGAGPRVSAECDTQPWRHADIA